MHTTMENRSARNLWETFVEAHPEFAGLEAEGTLQFFENEQDADRHASLVLNHGKTATSYSLVGLQSRQESLPKTGSFLIVVDGRGSAQCVVQITGFTLKPWYSITADHSRREGFSSLEEWKKTYWDYFSEELAHHGRSPQESMIIVCVNFEKIYG